MPALSVCVLTRSSAGRLETLLDEARAFADEVVVGVDAGSNDDTFDVAVRHADVTFRFEDTGHVDPARILVLDHASGDWILVLDDDERMDGRFAGLVGSLTADPGPTHYWFPRKWLVGLDPPTYVAAVPFYPDWQPRLFRNDRRLVWHRGGVHDHYLIAGPGVHEERSAVLHYERVQRAEKDRAAKLRRYLSRPEGRRYAEFYGSVAGLPMLPVGDLPTGIDPASPPRPARERVVEGVQPVAAARTLPPWGARLEPRPVPPVPAGAHLVVAVEATNTGTLRWDPPRTDWPRLFLSYHLMEGAGRPLAWDGERTAVGRVVDPGGSVTFLATLSAPSDPGRYLVRWDLVSEGECWFEECGSSPAESALEVTAR